MGIDVWVIIEQCILYVILFVLWRGRSRKRSMINVERDALQCFHGHGHADDMPHIAKMFLHMDKILGMDVSIRSLKV